MTTTENTPKSARSKPQAKPEKVLANNMFYIEGQKGKAIEEYAHIFGGHDDDTLPTPSSGYRTPENMRAYAFNMLRAARLQFADVTFTLIYRNHEGQEEELTD